MIFRQKKIKKKRKNIPSLKNNNFLGGFCSTITTPLTYHPKLYVSSRTQNVIPNAKCHPERCASSYALASKNASGSHHSSTKPLIPGFPIRSSSSSSQDPPAVDCSAGPPIASTQKKVLRVYKIQKKLHQTSKQNQRVFAQNRKPIFFLRSESIRSRLTRVPCWFQRFISL